MKYRSSLYNAATPRAFLFFVLFFLNEWYQSNHKLWKHQLAYGVLLDRGKIGSLYGLSVEYLVSISIWTLFFLYALARAYLLVAMLTSLRSVPADVYETVNWSLYFPHL